MSLPRLPRLWVHVAVPGAFAEDLADDLGEGFARRRAAGRAAAWRWLLVELARAPYARMWRQAGRMRAAGTRRELPAKGVGMVGWMTGLRVAARGLLGRPSYAAVVLTTLVVSIGSATLVFSVVEGVLLRPLPFEGAERIYRVYATNEAWRTAEQEVLRKSWDRLDVTEDLVDALAAGADGMEAVGAARASLERLDDGAEPERVSGARLLPGFFDVLALPPVLGRLPSAEELETGEPVVVLSERLWTSRYGRDPDVLGRSIDLNDVPHDVVGVLPSGHGQPSEATLWWAPDRNDFADGRTNVAVFRAFVRLAPDATPDRAREGLRATLAALAESNPAYESGGGRLASLAEETAGQVGVGIRMLFWAVVAVVLIACVNLANLMVARASRRRGELAMRQALGAGRGSLVWDMMAETVLVSVVGGALGVLVATRLLDPFVALLGGTGNLPRADTVDVNGTVLVFALGVTVATALLSGLGPALAASGRAPWAALQEGRRSRGGRGTRRTQKVLLLVEAALATVLLVVAGLLTRSAVYTATVDPGYEPGSVAYLTVSLPEGRYPERADRRRLAATLEARLARVPGASMVSRTSSLPGLGGASGDLVWRPDQSVEEAVLAWSASVSPGYFRIMGIPLLAGRGFEPSDGSPDPDAAVVSERFVERYFPGEDPLGRSFVIGDGSRMEGGRVVADGERTLTVVGVVGDVRQLTVIMEPDAMFYRPAGAFAGVQVHLVMRVEGDPSGVLAAARAEVLAVDRALIVTEADVLRRAMRQLMAPLETRTVLIVSVAGLAAFLTMVGIYGVVAYVVSDRRHEIGLRMALGARAGGEAGRMVRLALLPVGAGALLGILAAIPSARLLDGALFGVEPLDAPTYGVVATLLLGVAALSAWLPGRRAASVHPMEVLAEE